MPINVANVIVGHASIFTAPAGTAAPADDADVGVDWTVVGWRNVGATEEGLSLVVSSDTTDIRIEEQSTPAAILANAKNVAINFTLSEDTVESMKLAYGGGIITTTVAGTTQPAKKVFTLSDTLDRLAIGFEALNSFGFYRRFYAPTVLSVADSTTAYRRAENNRSYGVSLRVICPTSQIAYTEKTANHT